MLSRYASIDPRVSALGRFVKCWAKRRGLQGADRGFLSSYAWILQVIKYVQHCGLVPYLDQLPFTPKQPRIVDGHIIHFFDDNELDTEAVQAVAAARGDARNLPASLAVLAMEFMDFCHSRWVSEQRISIAVLARS